MGLCECSAPVLLMAEGGIPPLWREPRGMELLFSSSSGGCAGKRSPLQQLRASSNRGQHRESPCREQLCPAQPAPARDPPHTQPPEQHPTSFPPKKSSQLPLSPVLLCPPSTITSLSLLNFFCLAPRCSADFCAQNNFCSGNSSPSLSTLLQYFSLPFALRDVVEH